MFYFPLIVGKLEEYNKNSFFIFPFPQNPLEFFWYFKDWKRMIPILLSAVFWQQVVATEQANLKQAKKPSSEFCIKNPQYIYKTKGARMALNKEYWKKYAKTKAATLRRSSSSRPKITVKNNNKTTIIIAPHPDDEILCCTNTISEKIANGENVKIIYITDGDARSLEDTNLSQEYGQARRDESFLAAIKLGLSTDDLFFLGFPDGSLDKLSAKPLRSKFTGQISTPRNTFFPNTKYTKQNLKHALETIITKVSPAEIYLPSTLDAHLDHKAVGLLVREILRNNPEINSQGLEYLVHTESNELAVKANLKKADTKKLSFIRLFSSQFHTSHHRNFMEQFAAIPEVFEAILQRFAKK